ncbi:MAG: hypothetical protein MI924_23855 [Chloroflexales bacterium]|nr:hypothetical protein [Chloroflexales bacterium]
MKIIGAGMGRTGTKSLQLALQELGFDPCYHMSEVPQHAGHIDLWYAALQGALIDWETLLGQYQATVDFPGCLFYRDLMARYPDAKVLLSVRDPERWYESTYETIYQMTNIVPHWFRILFPPMGKLYKLVNRSIWQGLFKGQFADRQRAIQAFVAWNEQVQRDVPAEKLLVYNVKEGWEPLCAFLDVPVPNKPFPHVNDRTEMLQRIRVIRIIGVLAPALAGALLLGGALALKRLSMRGLTVR